MIINKKIAGLLLALLITGISFGQRKPDREKIKSLKVAYITEKLELTSKEAQAFWPIYNAHEEKLDAFRYKERKEIFGKLRDMDALTEKETEILLQELVNLEKEKHKAHQEFLKEIRKVLSAKKTVILLKTENGFKRRLLQRYRQKHGEQGRE